MRLFVVAACLALAAPVSADSRVSKPKPAPKVEKGKAKPTARPAAEPAPQTCKRKVVGKGLERKVVCEFETALVVSSQAPRPNVIVVQVGGRKVTGRPKVTDPLEGLREMEK